MGGTIDSRNAPERDGEAIPLRNSMVQQYIKYLRCNFETVFRQICMKDSRGVTMEDKDKLVDEILKLGAHNNIVTHGTYTMKDTAEYLLQSEKLDGRVVTLTGSMGTLLGTVNEEGHLMPSDGQFNLGYAIAQTFTAENGIYQSMNGEMFRLPDEWWLHSEEGVAYRIGGVERKF